ncbi:hypothetical protein BsWGS_15752 [Bradybaena similaris]
MEVLGLSSATGDFTRLHPRIIGGEEVRDRRRSPFNSMVALQFEASTGAFTFCSAVMLTDRLLVTAGSCVSQIAILSENAVTAVIGERDLQLTDFDEQRIGIESIRIHPSFNNVTFDNNIALLRLSRSATLSEYVKPIARFEVDPTACNDMDQSCLMVGWGPFADIDKPTNSRLPRSAAITVFGEIVTSLWSRFERGTDQPKGSLYAEAINPNRKACFFDWGGVVSCLRNGNYILRGVIGELNCNSAVSLPILVTDVPFYQTWIDQCTNDWSRC